MSVYCRNGHRRIDPVAGGSCTDCGTDLLEYVHDDPTPRWPIVLVVFAALTLVGVWWWWLWLAPH